MEKAIPPVLKYNYHMIQHIPRRNESRGCKYAQLPHSSIIYKSKRGRDTCVHQQIKDKDIGIYIQWNIVQPFKEILTHGTSWMKLKDIILTEISWLQRNQY